MSVNCIINSLKEVIYNLESTNILEINSLVEDIKDELEEIGKRELENNEERGLQIRDTVDELDNYTDCCNLKMIRDGIQNCILTLENLSML